MLSFRMHESSPCDFRLGALYSLSDTSSDRSLSARSLRALPFGMGLDDELRAPLVATDPAPSTSTHSGADEDMASSAHGSRLSDGPPRLSAGRTGQLLSLGAPKMAHGFRREKLNEARKLLFDVLGEIGESSFL